jgi:hypothetical protein
MEGKKGYSFELHEEMLSLIEKKFSPQEIAADLAAAVKGKPSPEILEAGKKLFAEYGNRWAGRVIELGESYLDRTYEIMLESINETGSPAFPLIPQRFIEIAYLSTQRLSTLPVVENNISRLIFKINDCRTYQAISEQSGEETAKLMVCREGCLNLCRGIIKDLKIDGIETDMSHRMPDHGFCQFVLKNTKS